MMKSKKGVSQIIAYVLLLGLAVGLGMLVTSWYLKSSKEQTEQILGSVEGGAICDEVTAGFGFDYSACSINVKNTGKFTIEKVEFSITDGSTVSHNLEYKEKIFPAAQGVTKVLLTSAITANSPITFTATLYVDKDGQLISCVKETEYTSDKTKPFTCTN